MSNNAFRLADCARVRSGRRPGFPSTNTCGAVRRVLQRKRPSKAKTRFAVCIENKGYEASLEIGKLYRVIPDEKAERHGYLRIIDESGEDYGYDATRFFAIDVPRPLERVLLKTAS